MEILGVYFLFFIILLLMKKTLRREEIVKAKIIESITAEIPPLVIVKN